MEIMQGKRTDALSHSEFALRAARFDAVHLDIGTGDGRYVVNAAQATPRHLVIGVDACRENLIANSRTAPLNVLFVIANAEQLPEALYGTASRVTVNFPWGSLLTGLLQADSPVVAGIAAASLPGAEIEVRLNAGALAEAGWPLEPGARQVCQALNAAGFALHCHITLDALDLRAVPTSWAKRIAFGRDPRALWLSGRASATTRAAL